LTFQMPSISLGRNPGDFRAAMKKRIFVWMGLAFSVVLSVYA